MKAVTTTGGAGQYTSLGSARTLATIVGTIPPTATHLYIECEGQNVRYRLDGNDPTASVGLRLIKDGSGSGVMLSRAEWKNFRAIEETASAKLNWQFYKT